MRSPPLNVMDFSLDLLPPMVRTKGASDLQTTPKNQEQTFKMHLTGHTEGMESNGNDHRSTMKTTAII